jgi:hypothetical protein
MERSVFFHARVAGDTHSLAKSFMFVFMHDVLEAMKRENRAKKK